jgi:tripartite-type tricarboxylate transporter receptor subunit TctC
MFKNTARIDVVSVSYKGNVAAVMDVIAGQSQFMLSVMQGGLPHVLSGKLRALAVTGATRLAALPDVPTISEAGAPGADFVSWNGVHVPARTPRAIIAKLNAELNRLVKLPDVRERMQSLGLNPEGGTSEAFAAFVKADIARWAKVIRDTGLRVE